MKSRSTLVGIFLLVISCTALPSTPQTQSPWLQSSDDFSLVSDTVLHIRDRGEPDGLAIVLVHGFGASLHSWDGMSDGLNETFRTIAFDLPGFGLSAPDAMNDYSDARAHQLIDALLKDRAIDQAVLIGHSLGGRIAWTFAANHPDRVVALVLISPDGYASPMFRYGEPGQVTWAMRALPYLLPRVLVRWALELSYGKTPVTADTVDRYHQLLLQPGVRRAILERTKQTVLRNPDTILPGIETPVLLIWGEDDRIIPVQNGDAYLNALPNARLVTLPDAGHVPHEEMPAQTLALVKGFLEDDMPK
ncbi:MAG: alpha/beta fold hydrolase [Pseudomonadota bacterium]